MRAVAVVAALLGMIGVISAAPVSAPVASAASASDFQPGFIVSDQNFFDQNALTADQIQAFLVAKEPTCNAGYTCLKDYRVTTPTVAANTRCGAYTGVANELASSIIYRIAQTCGISPKTLLVTLQKEQGLVTSRAPTAGAYQSAMGAGCPDTSACDSNYYGLFNQLRYGARLFKAYADVSSYPVGATSAILYSPYTAECAKQNGSATKNVFIKNEATHALYVYTPYTPDDAVLANLYGAVSGDACASYGNRNFWVYWSDWFGSPTNDDSPYGGIVLSSSSSTGAGIGNVHLHGWAVDPDTNSPITVHVTLDGTPLVDLTADQVDPNLSDNYVAFGTNHIFDTVLRNMPSGPHQYCVRGVNVGTGSDSTVDCRIVTVPTCTATGCPDSARIGGADRYAVSVQVSMQAFPGTAPVVYVASGQNYPDALSAAPAAAKAGGPLLLTASDHVPDDVLAEIGRLHPASIVVVGGPASVQDSVLTTLRTVAPTTRIGGADRFEASRNLASTMGSTSGVYIVNGLNFPDALSADAIAGVRGWPVVLVNGPASTLDTATKQFLAEAHPGSITIVGGPASVSPGVQSALAAIAPTTRLSGADRYAASQAAVRSVYTTAGTFYLASGQTYPDALTGSVLAASTHAPLYLTPGDCVSGGIFTDVRSFGVEHLVLLGGPVTLTDQVSSGTACYP